ncbi:MAG: acetoacetate--CoA ligase [Microthrixaceae bacterium]
MTDHGASPTFATTPLWRPPADRRAASNLEAFRERVVASGRTDAADYVGLHEWSITDSEAFWSAAWAELVPSVPLVGPAVEGARDGMLGARWFPEIRMNVAERILAGDADGTVCGDAEPMFVSVDERERRRTVTRGEARARVAELASALRTAGVRPGDRVAAWMPNVPETALLMLGAASVGAVFSSCSPDFGAAGVLDRFGQIAPTVLVAIDGYTYGGKDFDRRDELAAIVAGLPSLRLLVVLPFLDAELDAGQVAGWAATLDDAPPVLRWADWIEPHRGAAVRHEPLPFDHPWYVLFSSGTTGPPKCIVHRSGGVLLQLLKEHRLQLDVRRGDAVAYFTTCGWMMWNWLVAVPASGATAVLYEGNPFHPGPERLWRLVQDERLDFLGVSAKYLDAVRQAGLVPADAADLGTLRTLASTGSPLSPEAFEWVYASVAPGVGPDGLHLASISGGTDLCACFVCGDPTSPVYAGEIQRPALGMAVDVRSDDGTTAPVGERGELVCARPFPSMPLGFWADGDEPLGAVGPKYHAAYFERLDGVWAQGDFATWSPHGGIVIHGRSDTTLNPGGVRIGTAEIYRQVERVEAVVESLVVGLEEDHDVRIVLAVRLAPGAELDDALRDRIRRQVREGCTPRHVPSLVVQVDDLPRTRSGKLVELAVGDRVNGRAVRNTSALANPDALDGVADAIAAARGR